jgi:hypothetical protein
MGGMGHAGKRQQSNGNTNRANRHAATIHTRI